MHRKYGTFFIILTILLISLAGSTTSPTSFAPQSDSPGKALPTLDTLNLVIASPASPPTTYPTPTRAATITPFVTEAPPPTQELPLDASKNFTYLFSSDINVYCQGHYILQYTLKPQEKRTVQTPSGAYSCRVSGFQASNDLLRDLTFSPGEVFDWTFITI